MTDHQNTKKERLFGDISAAQVIATALAAVTSMLLSSYIGIAGSVIGVAVASVVSTLAASAYKKFIRDSAEKIKELPIPVVQDKLAKAHGSADTPAAHHDDERTSKAQALAVTPKTTSGNAEGASQKAEGASEAKNASGKTPSRHARDAQANASSKAAPRHDQKKLIRGLVIVCVLSALLAVAASGAAVYLLTTGEGLGVKPAAVHVLRTHDSEQSSEDTSNDSTASSGSSSASSSASSSSSSSSSSNAASSSTSSSAASSSASSSSASSEGSPETSSSSAAQESISSASLPDNPPDASGSET